KEVVLRHRHLLSYVVQTVELGQADTSDATLVSVPTYHIAGIGAVLTNLYAGRRVVYLADFSPQAWVDLVRKESISTVMLVPTMHPTDLPSLRAVAYGGSRVTPSVLQTALGLLPRVDFTNAYGLTETSSTIAILSPDDHRRFSASDQADDQARLGSVGQLVPG